MEWNENEDDAIIYHIVVNHEEQYSIWPSYKEMPGGWRVAVKVVARTSVWRTSRKYGRICVY